MIGEFGRLYEQQYAVALFNKVRFDIEGGGGPQPQLLRRKVMNTSSSPVPVFSPPLVPLFHTPLFLLCLPREGDGIISAVSHEVLTFGTLRPHYVELGAHITLHQMNGSLRGTQDRC